MVSSGRKDAALNPGEESALLSLREALVASKPITPQALELVIRIVTQWPYGDRLPGLDVLRCVARYPLAAQYSGPQGKTLLDVAIGSSVPEGEAPGENAAMMGARTLANLFGSADGRSLASSQADKAIAFLERLAGIEGGGPVGRSNRNVLIALTTSLVNFAVLAQKEKLLSSAQRRRLVVLVGAALRDQADAEVLYRALVALGTVLGDTAEAAGGMNIKEWIRAAKERCAEERVRGVADECLSLAR
ncbi:hypothetical protein G6O67_005265 [Ophiocordyceps sinensis]|nr:hypothetical protein G6O67_005265 [Ophiocordyceps sinensis]